MSFAQSTPNDAQIAAIVVAANTVDINAGEVAKSKSSNKEVNAFAQRMCGAERFDHESSSRDRSALATRKANPVHDEMT